MKPTRRWWFAVPLILVSLAAQAICLSSIPAGTPTARFIDNADGTVTDTRTGLMWMRCSLGQVWTGATCSGTASKFVWVDALSQAQASMFAGQTDWRLPNIKELNSIVERRCAGPAINEIVFPATPSGSYWSSSPAVAGLGTHVSVLGFFQGADFAAAKTSVDPLLQYHARLVRVVN